MVAEWSRALEIAGIGLGAIFLVLCLLAVYLWVVGKIIHRKAFSKHGDTGKDQGKES